MEDDVYKKVKEGLRAGMRWTELKSRFGVGSSMLTKARKELGIVRKATMTTPEDRIEILRLLSEGVPVPEIARRFGVVRSTISRIAANNGQYRNQQKKKGHWFEEWIVDREHLLDDKKALLDAIEQHIGKRMTREWANNVISKLGYSNRNRMLLEDFRAEVANGLRPGPDGLPSYGEKADAELFELLEVDGEPDSWIIDAYEAWLEARKTAVRMLRLEQDEQEEDYGWDYEGI